MSMRGKELFLSSVQTKHLPHLSPYIHLKSYLNPWSFENQQ